MLGLVSQQSSRHLLFLAHLGIGGKAVMPAVQHHCHIRAVMDLHSSPPFGTSLAAAQNASCGDDFAEPRIAGPSCRPEASQLSTPTRRASFDEDDAELDVILAWADEDALAVTSSRMAAPNVDHHHASPYRDDMAPRPTRPRISLHAKRDIDSCTIDLTTPSPPGTPNARLQKQRRVEVADGAVPSWPSRECSTSGGTSLSPYWGSSDAVRLAREARAWRNRQFGSRITNQVRALDMEMLLRPEQRRTYATESSVKISIPPTPVSVPPNTRLSDPLSRSQKFARSAQLELERQRLEQSLAAYSYLDPVGSIEDMRLTTTRTLFAHLKANLKSLSSRERSAVSSHRVPHLHLLRTEAEANVALRKVQAGEALSFDMEWSHNTRHQPNRTDVIQIASVSDIYVVQVSLIGSVPEQLVRIICDESVIKSGVAISSDATKLYKDYGHRLSNCVELSAVARVADEEVWASHHGLIGLRDLCRTYLQRRLVKDSRTRSGDWSVDVLDRKQLEYAASDVYVGIELLHRLALKALVATDRDDSGMERCNLFQDERVKNIMQQARRDPNYPSMATREKNSKRPLAESPAGSLANIPAGPASDVRTEYLAAETIASNQPQSSAGFFGKAHVAASAKAQSSPKMTASHDRLVESSSYFPTKAARKASASNLKQAVAVANATAPAAIVKKSPGKASPKVPAKPPPKSTGKVSTSSSAEVRTGASTKVPRKASAALTSAEAWAVIQTDNTVEERFRSPAKALAKSPTKAALKAPAEASSNAAAKDRAKAPAKMGTKGRANSPVAQEPRKDQGESPSGRGEKLTTKSPAKISAKPPAKSSAKSPAKVLAKSPTKASAKAPATASAKRLSRSTLKSPSKA